jgi:hypothetical protein
MTALIPTASSAQIPGIPAPGGISLPTGGLSKDALLQQAKGLVADLTSMKDSGKLAPEQNRKVDELLPKATSLTGELEQPQVDAARLPGLASQLGDLQKQLAALKSLAR